MIAVGKKLSESQGSRGAAVHGGTTVLQLQHIPSMVEL